MEFNRTTELSKRSRNIMEHYIMRNIADLDDEEVYRTYHKLQKKKNGAAS